MEILNCDSTDIPSILYLYEGARSLQTERKVVVWPSFEKTFIASEIKDKKQWKIVINGELACNWSIATEDKEIWGERDKNDSIYIHRICIHPNFRGNRFIGNIVQWAKEYAEQENKRFVRLDTLGNNTKLIEHYTSAGFEFLGIYILTETATLPLHYQKEPNCCLFEIDILKSHI